MNPHPLSSAFVVKIKSEPAQAELFAKWQALLHAQAASFPGFLSLEISSPFQERPFWTFRQRFSSEEAARSWQSSQSYQEMIQKLQPLDAELLEEVFSLDTPLHGVTQLFVTEVDPRKKRDFRKWLSKIHAAESKTPGFLGMYMQPPSDEKGRYWMTFLQFDSQKNLENWLQSNERADILKELTSLARGVEGQLVETPYAGWFGREKVGERIPPAWKQSLLVLLVLFPIVMVEMKFLMPLIHPLGLSLATFIGNALSVFLIAWPMMPLAIYGFRWWLHPQKSLNQPKESEPCPPDPLSRKTSQSTTPLNCAEFRAKGRAAELKGALSSIHSNKNSRQEALREFAGLFLLFCLYSLEVFFFSIFLF